MLPLAFFKLGQLLCLKSVLSVFINFCKVPSVQEARIMAHGADGEHAWWFKFSIDVEHALAWQTVQELGHVLNYLSTNERLPTLFFPVSPPPYMNGEAKDFYHGLFNVIILNSLRMWFVIGLKRVCRILLTMSRSGKLRRI